MAWQSSVLVLANVTADSDALLEALRRRAERGACSFTLVVPPASATRSAREDARERLEAALTRARDAGLEVGGAIGDSDPIIAVGEAFDPRRFDEIVVCTLPTGTSRWLQFDLPHRVARLTGVPVSHVVASEPRPQPQAIEAHQRERSGVLAPLAPLAWGGPGATSGQPRPRPPRAPH